MSQLSVSLIHLNPRGELLLELSASAFFPQSQRRKRWRRTQQQYLILGQRRLWGHWGS